MAQDTVIINGMVYNAHTGLPVNATAAPVVTPAFTAKKVASARTVHSTMQKSKTLNRTAVKKTSATHHVSDMVRRTPQTTMRSPQITKFAPHPVGAKTVRPVADIAPVTHPLQHHVNRVQASKRHPVPIATPKPSYVVKNEAITAAMKNVNTKKQASYKKPKKTKFMSLATASLALLLLAGYFTYINMPNLSVRVASSQAGIAASYPEYKPDGYSLNGPIAYSSGEVSMKFASNGGSSSYTISESKSNWDSSAVRDNYIKQNGGVEPTTHTERGLTIYIQGSNAAWVNRGILYAIKGDAPLSTEQIRRIATSL